MIAPPIHGRNIASETTFSLPLAPTANRLFVAFLRGGKAARAKTKDYLAWSREASERLAEQRVPHIPGYYEMSIIIPASTRGDISNRIKATEDIVVACGVVVDDRYADKVSIERGNVEEMLICIRSRGAE